MDKKEGEAEMIAFCHDLMESHKVDTISELKALIDDGTIEIIDMRDPVDMNNDRVDRRCM